MKTYFCVSDIHSFATPLIIALMKAKFDRNNKDHILVINGDLFDRGTETISLFNYISSIPANRLVLIRGNHEYLYLELLKKSFPDSYDFSNGTVKTFCDIAGYHNDLYKEYFEECFFNDELSNKISPTLKKKWNMIRKKVINHEITAWLKSDVWQDYFELNNYIITHSFIPVEIRKTQNTKWLRKKKVYQVDPVLLKPVANWRTKASKKQWKEATWVNPIKCFDSNLFKKEILNNKILICGHFSAYKFYEYFNQKPSNYSIYFSKNLIALDTCTVLSNDVNVLVIKDNICYDKDGNNLSRRVKNE